MIKDIKKFIEAYKCKPLGIKIISTLFFLISSFFLWLASLLTIATFSALVLSIVFFIMSIGIYKTKQWGHILTSFFSILWFLVGFLAASALLKNGGAKTPVEWLLIIGVCLVVFIIVTFIPIIISIYLTRPKIKEMFK